MCVCLLGLFIFHRPRNVYVPSDSRGRCAHEHVHLRLQLAQRPKQAAGSNGIPTMAAVYDGGHERAATPDRPACARGRDNQRRCAGTGGARRSFRGGGGGGGDAGRALRSTRGAATGGALAAADSTSSSKCIHASMRDGMGVAQGPPLAGGGMGRVGDGGDGGPSTLLFAAGAPADLGYEYKHVL